MNIRIEAMGRLDEYSIDIAVGVVDEGCGLREVVKRRAPAKRFGANFVSVWVGVDGSPGPIATFLVGLPLIAILGEKLEQVEPAIERMTE